MLLSFQTGLGEEQKDSKGYTLRQWEEWYKHNGFSDHLVWMTARAKRVRQSLERLTLDGVC